MAILKRVFPLLAITCLVTAMGIGQVSGSKDKKQDPRPPGSTVRPIDKTTDAKPVALMASKAPYIPLAPTTVRPIDGEVQRLKTASRSNLGAFRSRDMLQGSAVSVGVANDGAKVLKVEYCEIEDNTKSFEELLVKIGNRWTFLPEGTRLNISRFVDRKYNLVFKVLVEVTGNVGTYKGMSRAITRQETRYYWNERASGDWSRFLTEKIQKTK